MKDPNTTDMVTPGQPPSAQKQLDELPGLVGALDPAIFGTSGRKLPFVLMIFAGMGDHRRRIGRRVRLIKHLHDLQQIAVVLAADDHLTGRLDVSGHALHAQHIGHE
ncbi:hypothetical protein [Paraburkholderia elongata]|uniref:Uncharacterized protein n=1 Tax=Paraburkholderia elongata TaxID=2675747 RepID=A0A972NRK6_9BURK|nr:hypothetical protein [Paraburkholderia elongata]NPT58443.1 hypothetical protein [Paraburkholderia elongata]